jgi:thioredoxin
MSDSNVNDSLPSRVQPVTMSNFDEVMEQNPLVILDFWAHWCQPCKIFAPAFKMMADLHPDVFFGSVDTEVATDLAQAFQIRSIPTLMAFKQGDIVFEQAGLLPADHFEKLLQHLKSP